MFPSRGGGWVVGRAVGIANRFVPDGTRSNERGMDGRALTARAGYDLIAELLMDERMGVGVEPAGLEDVFPRLLRYSAPTQASVRDAYLAAFAMARRAGFVTFDGGAVSSAGWRWRRW